VTGYAGIDRGTSPKLIGDGTWQQESIDYLLSCNVFAFGELVGAYTRIRVDDTRWDEYRIPVSRILWEHDSNGIVKSRPLAIPVHLFYLMLLNIVEARLNA